MLKTLALAACLALAAAGAQAQTMLPAQDAPQLFRAGAVLAVARLDALKPAMAAAAPVPTTTKAFPHPSTVAETGFPQNSIDHAFSHKAMAQVGYLCGLQPGPNETAGFASSYDPEGTFLGAKLSLNF